MALFNLTLYKAGECAWKSEPRAFLDEEDAVRAGLEQYERIMDEMPDECLDWSLELRDFYGDVSRFAWISADGRVLH